MLPPEQGTDPKEPEHEEYKPGCKQRIKKVCPPGFPKWRFYDDLHTGRFRCPHAIIVSPTDQQCVFPCRKIGKSCRRDTHIIPFLIKSLQLVCIFVLF